MQSLSPSEDYGRLISHSDAETNLSCLSQANSRGDFAAAAMRTQAAALRTPSGIRSLAFHAISLSFQDICPPSAFTTRITIRLILFPFGPTLFWRMAASIFVGSLLPIPLYARRLSNVRQILLLFGRMTSDAPLAWTPSKKGTDTSSCRAYNCEFRWEMFNMRSLFRDAAFSSLVSVLPADAPSGYPGRKGCCPQPAIGATNAFQYGIARISQGRALKLPVTAP